jgi:transcriptional regulator of aromatic amino acid metabolism
MQQLMTKLPHNQAPREAKPYTSLPCAMIGAQAEAGVNFY